MAEKQKGSLEHRVDERKPVQWDAEIIFENDNYAAKISNVSLGGTLTLTEAPLVIDSELVLKLENLGEFAGIVVWVDAPYFGLALMAGPILDLKRFAIAEDGEVSRHPLEVNKSDWV